PVQEPPRPPLPLARAPDSPPLHGGPRYGPPYPPALVASRQSRDARLFDVGAPIWPPHPPRSEAPRQSRGARLFDVGASIWPPHPPRSEASRQSRGAPRFRSPNVAGGHAGMRGRSRVAGRPARSQV